MRDTKLVSLLKKMSAEDLRQIRKMLCSPFYTSNNNLLAYYSILKTCHPQYDSKKLEKERVFEKLFPEHTYSGIKLRNLNHELVRIIEDYWIHKDFRSDEFERKKKLLIVYKNTGHLDWFEKELKKLTDELNKLPYRDQYYYKQLFDLKLLQLEYVESKNLDSRYETLEEWEDALDNYYLLSKARQKITLKSLKIIIKPSENRSHDFNEGKNILYILYDKFEQLYDTENLDLFAELKTTFENNIHLIRLNLQVEFLSLLTNFAIKQMAVDDEKYNKVVLDLYKLGLKHQIIFTVDRISDTAFYNIAVCGSKAKEFDWTLNFIETYEKHLSPETKTDLKTLSLSTFYFHKKEFSKAVELIMAHYFKHYQIKITARIHAIRCYYELYLLDSTYYELLIAQIDNDERFTRRNENLPEAKLKTHMNYFNFIKKLATKRLNGKLRTDQQELMIDELSKQKITLSRSWLMEIIKK